MTKPTQQQLNKFWEQATKWQLRDIMRYTKNKEVRDKAEKHLPYDAEGKDYNTPHKLNALLLKTDWNKVFEKFAIFIMIFAVLYFGLHLFAFVVYQLAN